MIRSRKQARLAILRAILIAVGALVPAVGRGAAVDLSVCNATDDIGPYKDFLTLDQGKLCATVEDDVCAMMDDPTDDSTPPRQLAACGYAVEMIVKSTQGYQKAVEDQCKKVKGLSACLNKSDPIEMQQCKHDQEIELAKPEATIAANLEEAARRIKLAKDKLDEATEKFKKDRDSEVNKRVCGRHAKDNTPRKYYNAILFSLPAPAPLPPPPIFSDLGKVQGLYLKFNTAAASSITRHRTRSQGFADDAAKMAALNERMKTADAKNPDSSKSDVTGTDKKSAAPGGGAGGGSGGSSGGSKGPSQSPATALASAANGLSSGTTNASGDTSKKTGNVFHGDGNPALGASGTGLVDPSNKLVDKGSPFSAGLAGLTASGGLGGLGSSSSASSSDSGSAGGGARPSSAHSSGGGGGGASLADAVAGAERRCSGKDCQALAGVTPQFASVGSLGGSALGALDGLGGLDNNNAALDNLLKSDNKGAAAGDAMAGLDAATANLQADASGNGESQGADIGGANGGDLFVRMHEYHQRAQKRGMVVGLTRKL